MDTVRLTIEGQQVQVSTGSSILQAARSLGIYIPTLCYHPDLPPAEGSQAVGIIFQAELKIENTKTHEVGKGCGLCVVEIEGRDDLVGACATPVQEGMVVVTRNERITAKRRKSLTPILARHPHACLICAQQEGCSRTQCSSNVAENERCCSRFGHCELQNVANYVGISDSTPKWIPTGLPVLSGQPLFERNYNLCIGCTRCVRACRDLRGIEALGFVIDEKGLVQVGSLAGTLEASGCKFCTACVEVCPTGALADKAVRPGKKAEDLVRCRDACPAHIDVPGYLRLIAQGGRAKANAVIREKVPFPGVLGRVCIHPCEEACRRGEINEAISICALKRYAADGDSGLWKKRSHVAPDTGKRVAVAGAGPAGLTAAFYLRKKGHAVTVFESGSQAGGMLRSGIPSHRLPREILDQEIQVIFDLGIEFRPNCGLGRDVSLEHLTGDDYDAVFLAVGACLSRRIALSGCDVPDAIWGLDFLRQVARGEEVRLKDSVLVIGGGNVAVDAALTALRCGAASVSMACLECQDEMPADAWGIERAKAEGVNIMPSWGPDKIVTQDGRITAVDLVQCICVFDKDGKFCPQFGDRKKCLLVDQVILAIGQVADLSFLGDTTPIRVANGLIVVDEGTMETSMPKVYAGGDVTKAPGAVIHAIAAGRRAAAAIDQALGGSGDIDEVLFERDEPAQLLGRDEGFAGWSREKVPELDAAARRTSFDEICKSFSDAQAVQEAKRCLQCDLRLHMRCNPSPPGNRLAFDEEHIRQAPESEGVFQLLDENRGILTIKGTPNLRRELLDALADHDKAVWFEFEEDKMYSKRESELIQKYLQQYGEMPGGGDELDDLF